MNAFVEIIFDNSDGRLPIDKDEVAIKRAIGLKKDQYFLDKKVVTKADILNFLETAGFSRNNPYYIVKQGKINEISIAKDSFRLKILKEVAGSNVYDEKKQESKLILKETEDKRQNILDVLKAIEDRLAQLEIEKEELKEFQKWDKMKRSIEYTIHNKELEQTQNKLNELQKQRSESSSKSTELYEKLNTVGEKIKQLNKEIKESKSKEQQYKEEHEQIVNERTKYLSKRARYEFDLNDAIDEAKNATINKNQGEVELDKLNETIKEYEKNLENIQPEYERIRVEEEELTNERDMCDQKRQEFYAKQGRSNRFKSKEERDQWINSEIKQIDKLIKEKETLKQKLNSEIAEEQVKCDQYKQDLNELVKRSNELQDEIDLATRDQFDIQRRKDELQTKRNDLWRRENALTQDLQLERDEYQKCEQNLRSITGRTLLQGIESIKYLLRQFKQDNQNLDLVNGYYGLLIDNIDCDKSLYTAVETSVSSRLFYHIVENDRVAMRLLKLMNQQKLQGEVNFLPLNVLRIDNTIEYPDTNDAIPLIKRLKYETKVEMAIKHVFEKILLCRTIDVATTIAKQYQMDCVLLDGDLISRKGALTGGYVDVRQSKLSYHRQLAQLKDTLSQKENELDSLQIEIRQLDSQLNNVLNELQKHETRSKRNKDTYEQMKLDIRNKKAEIERIEKLKPQKERSIQSLVHDVQQYNTKKDMLQSELGTELMKQLSANEQQQVNELNNKIHELNQNLKQVLQQRAKIESEKFRLEHQLQNNLKKRKEQLLIDINDNKQQERTIKIDLYKNELNLLNEQINNYEIKLKDLEKSLKTLQQHETQQEQSLEQLSDLEHKLQEDMQDGTLDLERLASKLSILLKKKEECLKATRNLGVLPQDAYDKYVNYSMKELYARLDECNQELKKLSHVNKKAMDQYIQFSEHKEKLIQRREEADRAYESIIDFINTLDQRKNENMQFTFKQVSKYFSEIFVKLVPHGTGHLVMRRHDNFEEEDRQSSLNASTNQTDIEMNSQATSSQASTPAVDEYTGVGIRVSFVGKANEMKDIQQLSGGQKSLVALALIFAIQRCDPAPFYLFDEIDQALDPQYRKTVANMIHELSEKAQFITTTFRPELLEFSDKFYGVRFRNKISIIDCVSKEEAFDFVEDDQTHK